MKCKMYKQNKKEQDFKKSSQSKSTFNYKQNKKAFRQERTFQTKTNYTNLCSDSSEQTALQEERTDRLKGRNAVNEALNANRPIEKIWLNRNSNFDIGLQRLLAKAKEAGAVIVETDTKALERLAGSNHQGIVAQVAVKDYLDFNDFLTHSETANTLSNAQELVIMLDQINDPHNLGAVLRVADCIQASCVIVPKHRACTLDMTVAKTSAGAIEHVACCKVTNLSQAITKLKEHGYWVIACDMAGEELYQNQTLQKLAKDKLVIVIGNEGHGISQSVKANCDFCVSIPMYGHVNSLNASVAAAIVSYEIVRLRQK